MVLGPLPAVQSSRNISCFHLENLHSHNKQEISPHIFLCSGLKAFQSHQNSNIHDCRSCPGMAIGVRTACCYLLSFTILNGSFPMGWHWKKLISTNWALFSLRWIEHRFHCVSVKNIWPEGAEGGEGQRGKKGEFGIEKKLMWTPVFLSLWI